MNKQSCCHSFAWTYTSMLFGLRHSNTSISFHAPLCVCLCEWIIIDEMLLGYREKSSLRLMGKQQNAPGVIELNATGFNQLAFVHSAWVAIRHCFWNVDIKLLSWGTIVNIHVVICGKYFCDNNYMWIPMKNADKTFCV